MSLALQLESYAEGLDHVIVLRYKFACTSEGVRLSSSPLQCGFILSCLGRLVNNTVQYTEQQNAHCASDM